MQLNFRELPIFSNVSADYRLGCSDGPCTRAAATHAEKCRARRCRARMCLLRPTRVPIRHKCSKLAGRHVRVWEEGEEGLEGMGPTRTI